jgi:lysine 2,3-aminomutase
MNKPRLKSARDFREQPLIDERRAREIEQVGKRYAIAVTPHVMGTIKGDVSTDPVALQYIPQIEELKILPQENTDPIGDDVHTPVKGLVHRYADRVLLKATNICAVYCRYCFRREMVGPQAGGIKAEERQAALDYIRANKEIWEVILTGGDPLILSPRQLSELLDEIEAIEHVQVIRIHSRVPVAEPARITPELTGALKRQKAVYVALHINHAQEITPEVEVAIAALRNADCVLVSQSVLLKGVNDSAKILEELYRRLTALRVKPYYLHHGDLAPGTSHFRISLSRGKEIMNTLLARLSGIARPHYMLDIPGGHGKVPVNSCYVRLQADGTYELTDTQGNTHIYKDL